MRVVLLWLSCRMQGTENAKPVSSGMPLVVDLRHKPKSQMRHWASAGLRTVYMVHQQVKPQPIV